MSNVPICSCLNLTLSVILQRILTIKKTRYQNYSDDGNREKSNIHQVKKGYNLGYVKLILKSFDVFIENMSLAKNTNIPGKDTSAST